MAAERQSPPPYGDLSRVTVTINGRKFRMDCEDGQEHPAAGRDEARLSIEQEHGGQAQQCEEWQIEDVQRNPPVKVGANRHTRWVEEIEDAYGQRRPQHNDAAEQRMHRLPSFGVCPACGSGNT